ncbi:MAG: carbohydrate ABC transporter permease [Eubacteriales bacterium]|nr:carbohydrate ABC transporter permease [Eubacteriales bacterium]
MKTKQTTKSILLNVFLISLFLINILPILWMLSSAFKHPNELFTTEIRLIPHAPTLNNFVTVFKEYEISHWLINSVATTLGIAILQTVVAILAAYGLTYYKTKINEGLFYFFIITMVIPFQVTMIPNYILISRMKLINTWTGVIIPNIANASTFFFIRQHIRGIPKVFYEAASIEGANSLWTLRNVVLGICKGAISAMFILCIIDGWNMYFWPLLVMSKPETRTITVGLQEFLDHEAGNNWGPFMACATIATMPVIILYFFIQKNIIDAFITSGIKG